MKKTRYRIGQPLKYLVMDTLTGQTSKIDVRVDFFTPGFVRVSGKDFVQLVPIDSKRLTVE